MKVTYCDICDVVLKAKKHVIIIFEDDILQADYSYGRVTPSKDTFEVCDSCLKMIKDIFTYKTAKSKELKKLVDKIYETKSKIKRRRKKKQGEQDV